MKSLLLQIHAFPKRALIPVCDQSVMPFYVAIHVIGGRIGDEDHGGRFAAAGRRGERTFFVITKLVPGR
jgi:hypothetical protein